MQRSTRATTPGRLDADPTVRVPIDAATWLDARLSIPPAATGMVIFAHGSGSGRHSPRNRLLAEELQYAGLGTLLVDLLTSEEERVDAASGALRFDIPLLAGRLGAVTDFVARRPETGRLRIGYFGASTGAAAAIVAAAERPALVGAIVSRGGRPDLASAALRRLRAPTLLVVGGADPEVLALNRASMREMRCPHRLEIVPGATHLFEEPGALDSVAALARAWLERHLAGAPTVADER